LHNDILGGASIINSPTLDKRVALDLMKLNKRWIGLVLGMTHAPAPGVLDEVLVALQALITAIVTRIGEAAGAEEVESSWRKEVRDKREKGEEGSQGEKAEKRGWTLQLE